LQSIGGDEACPHVIFGDVLGRAKVQGLLNYVEARQNQFEPAVVRSRVTGANRIDHTLRNSMRLDDLGPFRAAIGALMQDVALPAAKALKVSETALEPREFCVLAYPDGSYFKAHIDTSEELHKVRALSCVYYFAATPRRFSGGALRIYAMPTLSAARSGTLPFIDVAPETDTLVVFPSWLRHEVLPVSVPSGQWIDGRFTVNCWLHRAA